MRLNALQFNGLGEWFENGVKIPSGFSFTRFLHLLYNNGRFCLKADSILYILYSDCVI